MVLPRQAAGKIAAELEPVPSDDAFQIGPSHVARGRSARLQLQISQRYTGDPVWLPVHVIRGAEDGPTLFVTAVVHGDELNGLGIVHELMFDRPPTIERGTLVLVPAVNTFGLETGERYLPDRRDLNRCFPGLPHGSLTARLADVLFCEVVRRCDFGIDLHTAAAQRTNYPNVRGDLANAAVRRLARAFGCELLLHSPGPAGSLRREATRAGCPTIVLEAGEPRKIEPAILQLGVRGVLNVLCELGMVRGQLQPPARQTRIDRTTWVRAQVGGILRFHVAPGALVEADQPLATNTSVFGREQNVLRSPVDGIILGMTTLPLVKPGEPVCHVAVPRSSLRTLRRALASAPDDSPLQRMRQDLARNISVTEHEAEPDHDEADGDD